MRFQHWSNLVPMFRWSWGRSVRRIPSPRPWAPRADAADRSCCRPAWSRCSDRHGRAVPAATVLHSRTLSASLCRIRAEHRLRPGSTRTLSLGSVPDRQCPIFGLWLFCRRPERLKFVGYKYDIVRKCETYLYTSGGKLYADGWLRFQIEFIPSESR